MYEDWGRILKIGNFTQQDAGEYECGAVNEDGASSVGQKFAVTAEGEGQFDPRHEKTYLQEFATR